MLVLAIDVYSCLILIDGKSGQRYVLFFFSLSSQLGIVSFLSSDFLILKFVYLSIPRALYTDGAVAVMVIHICKFPYFR